VKAHQEQDGDRMGEIACSCNFERAAGLVAISVVAEKKATKTLKY
jgi:hypothetical protein